MTGNVSKVVSLVTGLAFGSVYGVYLAQNYTVPNVSSLLGMLQKKAEDFSKSDNGKKND